MNGTRGLTQASSFEGAGLGHGQPAKQPTGAAVFYPTLGGKGKPIFVNVNGRRRIAGIVFGDILRKVVSKERHYCRSVGGWGVDLDVLQRAKGMGAPRVVIVSEDGGEFAAMSAYFDHGVPFNEGYGKQLVLPRSYFRGVSYGQGRLFSE